MHGTIDILQSELERLFSLEEMTRISQSLLALDPADIGGTGAKSTFARALTERCVDGDRVEALVDCILVSRSEVDPRVRDLLVRLGSPELAPGHAFGSFVVQRKIGESDLAVTYVAQRGSDTFVVKAFRPDALRDRRSVQRFLTANRLAATVSHPGLPRSLEADELRPLGVLEGVQPVAYVAYAAFEAQSLAQRLLRSGPSHINEIKPILRGILSPLAALHAARLSHGDLKFENVLIDRSSGSSVAQMVPGQSAPSETAPNDTGRVVLVDFATDRLRHRSAPANGHAGLLAVFGSPKTIAPEQVRGKLADARTDVYAFGAILYELLSGKPVFAYVDATDAAFLHLSKEPEPPSAHAPRGWVSRDVDAFVLSLLSKDPSNRPKDARAVLDIVETLGRASVAPKAATLSSAVLDELTEALTASPSDPEVAIRLEKAVDDGADALRVAKAFGMAAAALDGELDEDAKETKKSLLFRAARVYTSALNDKEQAEATYAAIVAVDPKDDVALIALEEVRKALGKYEDVVEMLLARNQAATSPEERARAMADIGHIYAADLADPEQALVAFTQALSESPGNDDYAAEIERLAGENASRWSEVLEALTQTTKSDDALSSGDRNRLLARMGRWFESKARRPDMALLALQQILVTDPANDAAGEGLTAIYRNAEQWQELVAVLSARADSAGETPRRRDWLVQAAEVLEAKVGDDRRAKALFASVFAVDPDHARAADGLVRLAEKAGDHAALVELFEKRAESQKGRAKADAMAKIGELYEGPLKDASEAARRFEAALSIEPSHLASLKGLDRIYGRIGRYKDLLDNLERQVAVAATPRQKVQLFERIAKLHEEEFLDSASAAEALETILEVEATNEAALTGLLRHYRSLGRWEDLVSLYERHGALASSDARRIELHFARARVLVENIGSPDRAMRAYEQVLELDSANAAALEALSHLRAKSGDARAALSAIETLAHKATTTEAKAEQWNRAARLLEQQGDEEGAIERYKRALEAHPSDTTASPALRRAYADRGEAAQVVLLIEQAVSFAEGNLQKARLYAELAVLQREKLSNDRDAEAFAKKAVELDVTNVDALRVLGDIAFEAGRFVEASKLLESLVARTQMLDKADAVRVLLRYIEAVGKASAPLTPGASIPPASFGVARGSVPPPSSVPLRIATAVEALGKLAPEDVEVLARTARALFDHGDAQSAKTAYERLLAKAGDKLGAGPRGDALYRLGESARRVGDIDGAVKLLQEAASVDPANTLPLKALSEIYESKSMWEDAIRTKTQRLEIVRAEERFDLLLEIGDLELNQLGDRPRAQKSYAAALEERPDDRRLLTKLMQVYSEEKDWARLVEVVVRLADFVEDPKQRAKYMHTAAIVSSRQLGDVEQAIAFYDRALEFDPALQKAVDEAIALRQSLGDHAGVEHLLKVLLSQAKEAEDRPKLVAVLDRLGELYGKYLGEPELAVDAYEAAHAFDPDHRARAELLANLYASDVGKHLEKAVRSHSQILRRNPYRMESYKLLRKLYTEAKRADAAWCLCQALSVLHLAEPDEERFYSRHRADNAAPAQAVLDEADWARLAHADVDPLVTRIFAMIQACIIEARTQSLEAMGCDVRDAIDLARHPHPIAQTLYYAHGVLGIAAPPVFEAPNDPGGLGFLHAHTPAIVLGHAVLDENVSTQAMAFVAGRHLAYFRPGFYVRHLVPTGTGLKAWLFAAIKLSVSQFPIAPDLEGPVRDAMARMSASFQGVQRELLASQVSKLLQSGTTIDLKKWVASIDLTADRAGFLLAHDLERATEVMRATEDAASVPAKERMKELVLFAVSEEYFALRQKLGITVES